MSDKKREKTNTKYWTPDAPVLPGETFSDLAKTDPGPGRPTDENLPDVKSKKRFKDAFVEAEPRFPLPRARTPFPRLPISEAGAGPRFSINDFAANIRAQLSGKCTGWAFVINKNGQEAIAEADGDAIVEGDQLSTNISLNQRSFTPDTRVQVASVSKTITAIAVLRLLQDTGIGLNAAVWPYLPLGWELGNDFEEVQFRHLLSHTSGMTGVFSDALSDEEAKLAVVLGASPGAAPAYRNINFTLFRYIIPKLWAEAELPHAHGDSNVAASFFYAVYIIERIFSQMGGAIGENASTGPLEPIPTRYYPSAGATQGMDFPNFAPLAGAAGWFMSARELAAIMAFLTYTENLIDDPTRTVMDAFRLGWREPGFYQGAFGDYLGHGGFIFWNDNGVQGRVRTAVMKFGVQVEAALVANSEITGLSGSAGNILVSAYDAAWS